MDEPNSNALLDEAEAYLLSLLPRLTSRPDLLNRHLGACFLARSTALLRGMRALNAAERGDCIGVLLRALVEAHLLGLYVLYGDEPALMTVMGDHRRNVEILATRNQVQAVLDEVNDWEVDNDRVILERVADELGPLLHANGDPGADVNPVYQLLIRAESTFSVHGAGAALRYLEGGEELLAVRTEGIPTKPGPWSSVALGAIYTLYLARHVAQVFGFDPAPGDAIYVQLTGFMHDNAPTGTGLDSLPGLV